ncbi:PAS domain S-box protein [Dethiosulfatarculus sandiegensis]|uniref:histidine kinase n=1 Tax=Dethiosulfatarculus sandiegensis TaxID=1429043 RepID=A0A0D2IYK4_9BACT|nr:PAS domain S-box protein [Dethiosulfatarculus sandiegensis]KIX11094.1 histidine kinase [Dethiosulfatarculus sandiegensis]
MGESVLKTLVVEDDYQFKELITDILKQTGKLNYQIQHATTLKEAFELLDNNEAFDLAILDLHLPDSSGLETVQRLRAYNKELPILVLTGQREERFAQRALEAGAQEFLLKEEVLPGLLLRSMRYAVERKHTEERLKESEQRQKAILDSVQVGIFVIDPEGHTIVETNPAALAMIGKTREEVIGRICHEFVCPILEGKCPLDKTSKTVDRSERELICSDGSLLPILKTVATINLNGKKHFLESFLDITQIKEAQVFLEKSRQKLEQEVGKRTKELEKAKNQWESTFDAVPDLIMIVDQNFNIIRANQAVAAHLKTTPRLLVGQKCFQLLHESKSIPENCPHLQMLKDGAHHMAEMTEKSLNSDLLLTASPLKDSDGKVYASVHVARDISALKKAQRRLSEQVDFMRALVEAIPYPVYLKNTQGKFTDCNRAFAQMYGKEKSEILGLNSFDLAPQELADKHYQTDQALWKNRKSQIYEAKIISGKNKQLDVIINKAVFHDSDNNPLGIVGVVVDITERKRMAAQLIKAQRLDAIGQLAAGIAHEINTPTQYIHNNIEFLGEAFENVFGTAVSSPESNDDKPHENSTASSKNGNPVLCAKEDFQGLSIDIKDALDGCLEGIERISAIVSSMRYFSHPGTDHKAPIDVNNALEHAITVSRNEWKYYADVKTQLDQDLPYLEGYAAPLNQAILNLIVNAAQAISQVLGENPKEKGLIHIKTQRLGQTIEIKITDNGPGIPEEILPRIFDPFFTTKEVGKGTGQGLALVNAIVVEKHGGNIEVETEIGKGTSFIIQLPVE